MRKLIGILLLSLSIITLIACSKNNYQSLDGEYYWISSERNELAFTIKGNNASIEHGEADSFTINKQKNTIELTGQNIASRTEEYSFNVRRRLSRRSCGFSSGRNRYARRH